MKQPKKKDIYLCTDCSDEVEIIMLAENIFKGIWGKVHNNILAHAKENFVPANEKNDTDTNLLCSGCGIAFAELKKGGNLGCASCYSSFFKELISVLTAAQDGPPVHDGKHPKRGGEAIKNDKLLFQLQFLRDQAIEAEDFDTAAIYRDKIKLHHALVELKLNDCDDDSESESSARGGYDLFDIFCPPDSIDEQGSN